MIFTKINNAPYKIDQEFEQFLGKQGNIYWYK